MKGVTGAGRNAQAATDAAVFVYHGMVLFHVQRFHLATLQAGLARDTRFGVHARHKCRGRHRRWNGMALEIDEDLTTIAAAAADVDDFLCVAGLKHQPLFIRFLKNLQGLLQGDHPVPGRSVHSDPPPSRKRGRRP